MRNIIQIDPDRCKSCGLCIESCPRHCLSLSTHCNPSGYQPVRLTAPDACTGCGTCALICPEPMALTLVAREKTSDTSSDQSFLTHDEGDATLPEDPDALAEALAQQAADALTDGIVQKLSGMITESLTKAILEMRRAKSEPSKLIHAFLKGNDAVICAALASGCRAFFGYPITPASEIAHDAMAVLPKVGAIALQAESEVSAINMLYGAGSTGVPAMTATSGPGFSLMQEGISYMAAARLPGVIVDVMRSGPGLGNIGPEQGDYFMATHGGGHGHYHTPVLAPWSVSEMFSMTCRAFDIAFQFRTPVIVLADAFIGQVMETIELPTELFVTSRDNTWAARPEFPPNTISSLELSLQKLERLNDARFSVYEEMRQALPECRISHVESPKALCIAFGICARIASEAQSQSGGFDLFRPLTLWPFPEAELREAARCSETVLVVECNRGQMLEDIRRILPDKKILFLGHDGGVIPTSQEILELIK